MGRRTGNSVSVLEAFARGAALSGKQVNCEQIGENRAGDHICCTGDVCKIKAHYPSWGITGSPDHRAAQNGGRGGVREEEGSR